jgi:glutathione peroxidase
MKKLIILISILFMFISMQSEEKAMSIYDFTMEDIKGDSIKLDEYKGKIILIVNTASKCGFTYQYDGLEKLYQDYKEQGFIILGFPANNFLKQDPGSNEEIANFCRLTYGVTFPMFSKISVKGKDIHPLYEYLTSKNAGHNFGGKISWNFNKFMISKDGKIINRFGSKVKPEDEKIVNAIEQALK